MLILFLGTSKPSAFRPWETSSEKDSAVCPLQPSQASPPLPLQYPPSPAQPVISPALSAKPALDMGPVQPATSPALPAKPALDMVPAQRATSPALLAALDMGPAQFAISPALPAKSALDMGPAQPATSPALPAKPALDMVPAQRATSPALLAALDMGPAQFAISPALPAKPALDMGPVTPPIQHYHQQPQAQPMHPFLASCSGTLSGLTALPQQGLAHYLSRLPAQPHRLLPQHALVVATCSKPSLVSSS